jgi:hypothetical protein
LWFPASGWVYLLAGFLINATRARLLAPPMKKSLLALGAAFLALSALGQPPAKETVHVGQVWLAYFNQARLSQRWGIWTDFHLRTRTQMVGGLNLGIARAALIYHLGDQTRLMAGYAYIHFFPNEDHPGIFQPEHRPWQMVQWQAQYPKVRTTQAVRLEQRFRRRLKNDSEWADGYLFNYRLRLNLLAQFPLSKSGLVPHTFSVVLANEVFLNFGQEIVYNYFDQNRFFLGSSYQFSKQSSLQFGYMNIFQQLPAGNQFRHAHSLRLFYLHNLDWRKRD